MLQRWLPKQLEVNDDLTLEEHREAFEEEYGETVSTSTVGRAISSLPDGPWPIKKSRRYLKSVMSKPEGCGGGSLPTSTLDASYSWTSLALTPP